MVTIPLKAENWNIAFIFGTNTMNILDLITTVNKDNKFSIKNSATHPNVH